MDVIVLRTFVTIVEEGSFGAAARKLGYSQSTVSAHIRRLERYVGVRLVEREGAVRLTWQGADLLPRAQRILGEVDLIWTVGGSRDPVRDRRVGP